MMPCKQLPEAVVSYDQCKADDNINLCKVDRLWLELSCILEFRELQVDAGRDRSLDRFLKRQNTSSKS